MAEYDYKQLDFTAEEINAKLGHIPGTELSEADDGKVLMAVGNTLALGKPSGFDPSLTRFSQSLTWDGSSESTMFERLAPALEELVGATGEVTTVNADGIIFTTPFTISTACKTGLELEGHLTDENALIAVAGGALGAFPHYIYIVMIYQLDVVPLAVFDRNLNKVTLGRVQDGTSSGFLSSLNYNVVKASVEYQGFYNSMKFPVKILSITSFSDVDALDFSNYEIGDILLVFSDELTEASNGN